MISFITKTAERIDLMYMFSSKHGKWIFWNSPVANRGSGCRCLRAMSKISFIKSMKFTSWKPRLFPMSHFEQPFFQTWYLWVSSAIFPDMKIVNICKVNWFWLTMLYMVWKNLVKHFLISKFSMKHEKTAIDNLKFPTGHAVLYLANYLCRCHFC